MKRIIEQIDKILEKDNYWSVDTFPTRINDWDKFKWIESYLLKKEQKKEYIKKVINIVFKIVPYFNCVLYIGDTSKKKCKRYEGSYNVDLISPYKLKKIIRILMQNEEQAIILLESFGIALYLELYNSAIYVVKNQNMSFFEEIVKSEGLFLRK